MLRWIITGVVVIALLWFFVGPTIIVLLFNAFAGWLGLIVLAIGLGYVFLRSKR